jgi:hypothetical protein
MYPIPVSVQVTLRIIAPYFLAHLGTRTSLILWL